MVTGGGEQQHSGGDGGEVAALWGVLAARLVERIAHEVRNPLNGAMVNLQVVGTRSERPGIDAASLTPFAQAATAELERAAALVEALLAALRFPRPGEDVASSLRVVAAVYAAAAQRAGATLVTASSDAAPSSVASPLAVRAALALALEGASEGGGEIRAALEETPEGARVRVHGSRELRPLDSRAVDALGRAGVEAKSASSEYILVFPATAGTKPWRT